jgi:hypothetical protein
VARPRRARLDRAGHSSTSRRIPNTTSGRDGSSRCRRPPGRRAGLTELAGKCHGSPGSPGTRVDLRKRFRKCGTLPGHLLSRCPGRGAAGRPGGRRQPELGGKSPRSPRSPPTRVDLRKHPVKAGDTPGTLARGCPRPGPSRPPVSQPCSSTWPRATSRAPGRDSPNWAESVLRVLRVHQPSPTCGNAR